MAEKKKSVYASIADDIIEKIKTGTYPMGSLLPPEREFMKIYDVQRTTVRRGLEILSSGGYIKKVAGLGSVVSSTEYTKTSVEEKSKISVKKPEKKTLDSSAILLPEKDLDKLPKLVVDLVANLGKSVSFMAQSLSQLDKYDSIVSIDAEPETDKDLCLALCQSDDRRSVVIDNDKGAYIALTYLESLGHTKIAFIGTQNGLTFENTAYDAFSTVNSFFDEALVNLAGADEKSGFDGFSELFRRHGDKFSAVCTVNDEVAKGVIKAAKYYKTDISVISLCSSGNSPVDAIVYDTASLADEIIYSLENSKRIATILFSGNLSVKGSCFEVGKSATSGKNMSNFLL